MKIKIAENIRALRKENSFTQEQLAEALGVTVSAVYKWESGLGILKKNNVCGINSDVIGLTYAMMKKKRRKQSPIFIKPMPII